MEQVKRSALFDILKNSNPGARADDLQMYFDAFVDYVEAAAKVAQQGAIVLHPRTGAPLDNPYLKVKAGAAASMQKITRITQVDSLWNAITEVAA